MTRVSGLSTSAYGARPRAERRVVGDAEADVLGVLGQLDLGELAAHHRRGAVARGVVDHAHASSARAAGVANSESRQSRSSASQRYETITTSSAGRRRQAGRDQPAVSQRQVPQSLRERGRRPPAELGRRPRRVDRGPLDLAEARGGERRLERHPGRLADRRAERRARWSRSRCRRCRGRRRAAAAAAISAVGDVADVDVIAGLLAVAEHLRLPARGHRRRRRSRRRPPRARGSWRGP